jgi:CDP-diacylglycerol--glycerol-3-phosphate 3-phosphatidyltransferase
MSTTANKITVLRIVLVPVFLLLEYLGYAYAAFAVFVVASLSDMLDGYIARKYNQITVFGKFMDPLADKMLVLAAMCYLIETGAMPGWAVAVVIFREFAVSGLRLVAAERSIVIAAAQSGKIKTACTMVCLCIMLFFLGRCPLWLNSLCIALIVVTTVYSGFEYFRNNYRVFSE